MKKTITILLILILAGTGLFAAVADNFTVTTDVSPIDLMTVSTVEFTGTTKTLFEGLTAYTNFAVNNTNAGTRTGTGWLSTLSNNRKGYVVTMAATAMTSTVSSVDAYIDYIVEAGTAKLTTHGSGTTTAEATNVVVTVPSLTALAPTSTEIFVTVNKDAFDAAVAGSYTGTVTFTYTANN